MTKSTDFAATKPDAFLSPVEEHVLRLSFEPLEYIDDYVVHEILTTFPEDYFGYVLESLQRIARQEATLEMSPKQIFSNNSTGGDFRVMPCRLQDRKQILQTVKLVGTNAIQEVVPDQITVGKAFVLDARENYVSHIFDACLLSSARTGLCAVLAMTLLPGPYKKLTILGAGRVGYYTAFFAAARNMAEEIVFCDLLEERSQRCASALGHRFPGMRVKALSRAQLTGTDILVLATTSHRPVYGAGDFPAELVISLGADIDYQHELDSNFIPEVDIFVDTLDSSRYGDLRLWLQQGLICRDDLRDVFDLLRDGCRRMTTPRKKLFISTGSGVLDNLTMGYILKQRQNGLDEGA